MVAVSSSAEEIMSYIRTPSGEVITSQENLKVLGFIFRNRPSVQPQVDHMCKKFCSRVWILRHLKGAGVPCEDLKKLYLVLVIPVLDYAVVVYHSLLSRDQAECLERLQICALKIIYGFSYSAADLHERAQIECLWERRERLVKKFLHKTAGNPRFSEEWFPKKTFTPMDLRKEFLYEEKFARTDRVYKSPKYFFRRRLNGGLT